MGSDATGNFTLSYPSSVAIAVVAVDPDTGTFDVEQLAVVDDAGNAVNPQVVHGQAHGGAAQANGAVRGETLRIDDDTGRLQNGTFDAYPVPTAREVPTIQSEIVKFPSPNTPGGWKGVGEGAFVSGPAAIANAVADAIDHPVTELPLDPETVRSLL